MKVEKHKKIAFIISIVLFIIFLPLTIIGMVSHFSNANPNHEFHYKDKLYFYNGDTLLGTYDCNYENCGYAKEFIEDSEYGINYFNLAFDTNAIINNRFAIIADYLTNQDEIIIYDILNKTKIASYSGYKMYNVGIADNYLIVIKDGKYGVIQLNDTVIPVLEFAYDFIGLQNERNIEQNKISIEKLIVKQNDHFSLINIDGSNVTPELSSIITSYNSSSLVLKDDSGILGLYNYDGTIKLPGNYKRINYLSNYIEITDNNGNYSVLDKENLIRISQIYQVSDESNISTKVTEQSIEVIIDGETKETIEI